MPFRMTEMVGCEFPLFAFSHCRDVVAAVSRAGGFGVLGAVSFTPEQLETELQWIDDHVDGKPYEFICFWELSEKASRESRDYRFVL